MQKSAAVLPQGLTVTYQDTTSPGQLLQQAVAQALEGSNTQIEEAHRCVTVCAYVCVTVSVTVHIDPQQFLNLTFY